MKPTTNMFLRAPEGEFPQTGNGATAGATASASPQLEIVKDPDGQSSAPPQDTADTAKPPQKGPVDDDDDHDPKWEDSSDGEGPGTMTVDTPVAVFGPDGQMAVPAETGGSGEVFGKEVEPGDPVEADTETVPGPDAGGFPHEDAVDPEGDRIATLNEQFPDFGPWFDRVQKWAQFNSRPIPEPNAEWEEMFSRQTPPDIAAETKCLRQP